MRKQNIEPNLFKHHNSNFLTGDFEQAEPPKTIPLSDPSYCGGQPARPRVKEDGARPLRGARLTCTWAQASSGASPLQHVGPSRALRLAGQMRLATDTRLESSSGITARAAAIKRYPWLGARRRGFEPRPHLGTEACVWWCACLDVTRSEISRTVSSTLSPVSVSVQKSYMTP